jgi:hypothetical protein
MSTEFYNAFMNSYDTDDSLKKILLNSNDLIEFIKNFDDHNLIYKLNYIHVMRRFIKTLTPTQTQFFKELLFDLLNNRNIKDISDALFWKESREEPTSTEMYINHLLRICPTYTSFRNFFTHISDDDWNTSIQSNLHGSE